MKIFPPRIVGGDLYDDDDDDDDQDEDEDESTYLSCREDRPGDTQHHRILENREYHIVAQ